MRHAKDNQRLIQQLLAAVGSRNPCAEDEPPAHEPYNWRQARYFNESQMAQVNELAASAAQLCAATYSQLFRHDYSVTAKAGTQHYAYELMQPDAGKDRYTLHFGPDPNAVLGMLELPLQTARQWIGQFLGDTPDDSDSHPLSPLEKTLLLDVADGTLKAFAQTCSRDDFRPVGSWTQAPSPPDWDEALEICRLTLESRVQSDSDQTSLIHMLIPCKALKSLLGADVDEPLPTEQETYEAILSHVRRIPVSITARLAAPRLSVQETLYLETGDVVCLETGTNQPIELMIKDRCLFQGRLAQSQGDYAVIVTETMHEFGQPSDSV